ncbi:transcriptional regulator with PAS, ATPase and Fis domain [Salsuginibacillus halophilus]|uniref:Transcriptional regulator with PAS, ATPase and Fis domain n=1 Tax=Salsuginibacillus halophilus TaxID=517424 RepID=A0A2P8HWM2_9BACI|nr:sigma 54-interacting transcriptional regulator [Salsuginibacillus halophilus]PSL50641.1 transcriptional regulator with PAS, ATPase and Fis domain [Salsuginibacillus halophilus]
MNDHKDSLVCFTGTKETKKAVAQQLKDVFDGSLKVEAYAVEEGLPTHIETAYALYSSALVYEEVAATVVPDSVPIIAGRMMNFHYLDELLKLPPDTPVLYVNDTQETIDESIASLRALGIDHIHWIPYAPNQSLPKAPLTYAVTCGEPALIPEEIPYQINIGARLLDFSTIYELSSIFFQAQPLQHISESYLKQMVQLQRRVLQAQTSAEQLSTHLYHVLNGVNDGILAFDTSERVTVCNERLARLLHIPVRSATHLKLKQLLPFSDLQSFLLNGAHDTSEVFDVYGNQMLVHRMERSVDGIVIATFDAANTNGGASPSFEVIQKGQYAKYSFDDILGHSPVLNQAKALAKKLSLVDHSILITGETGTGKELFASAIHQASPRAHGPYLAVNVSSLPEHLLESELFGYVDGAFTGARKGGKKGLFEQAQGGTIFLDEIGDISPTVQARLLRVLQEKEVLRIGGENVLPVNVRVISATNKDLAEEVYQGRFRSDLYHRMNVLQLSVPPLRNRPEDIESLLYHFLDELKSSTTLIPHEVVLYLQGLSWPGNVRELKNIVSYMATVAEGNTITMQDLPERLQQNTAVEHDEALKTFAEGSLREDECTLIQQLMFFEQRGINPGRKRLERQIQEAGMNYTEHHIRTLIDQLADANLVIKGSGRRGIQLTDQGRALLKQRK